MATGDKDQVFGIDEIMRLLKDYPLNKNELRRCIRQAARVMFNKEQEIIGRGWGIRTGRLSREGLKLSVDRRSEAAGGAAYAIRFSKKSGKRGTSEYMADTFKARWLEGGTDPHYTAKGATNKKAKRGALSLNARQRKLKHPGFKARPIIEKVVEQNRKDVINMVRSEVERMLKSKIQKEEN